MTSFAIEAPAETNPFTLQALQVTLLRATSGEVNQIQSSTKQLQKWETTPGYYGALQDVFIQGSLPTDARMLALIQLKNGIDKYWRKSANNAVKLDERSKIREKLIQSTIQEPVDNLASLNAVVTAKIARYDFPGQWPELVRQLGELINSSTETQVSTEQESRILLLTHHVIKELSTVRLQKPRTSLQSDAPLLFASIRDCYNLQLQEWQKMISAQGNALDIKILHSMKLSEQALKILRRLVLTGWDFPHRTSEIENFWTESASHMQLYLSLLHQTDIQHAYRMSSSRHLKQTSKFHLSMARDHPTSFALFQTTVDMVRTYWNAAKELRRRQLDSQSLDEELSTVYDGFNLRAILILRACFKEAFTLSQPFKYRNSDGKDEPPRAREILSQTLLTDELVQDLFQLLVSQFFIYVSTDVEQFFADPEEWDVKDEGNEEDFEKSVRAAAERLFMDITLHHKDIVIEPLLATVSQLSSALGTDSRLMKDAVYAAIGVAAPILSTRFDFNSFLRSTLVLDLKESEPMYSVVRRRIAILLAKWIPIDINDENRPVVYEAFQVLLDKNSHLNNLAVRITTGKRLKDVIDEIGFKSEAFSPYASDILLALLDLIREVEHLETKLALLSTISTLVERMEKQVSPFASQVVGILETLWSEAANENMMKTIIVTILQKLVHSMKSDSVPFHSIMLHTIKAAIEPGSDSQLYMLEDAMNLWMAILQNASPPASQDMLSLVHYLPSLYELDDAMHRSLIVTTSYLLIAPSEMLHDDVRKKILNAYPPLLTVRDSKVPMGVTENIELMIRAADGLGGQEAVQLLLHDLLQSSVLSHALGSIMLSWESRQTTGPNRKDPPSDWKNETDYFVILSRIILASLQAFETLIIQFAREKSLALEVIMARILEECFSHMDAIGRPTEKKLICMALTNLLETGQPWVLDKLQDLMALWTSMIVELNDGEADTLADSLVSSEATTANSNHTETPENLRKQALKLSDPVHTTRLGYFVRHYLRTVIDQVGGEAQFQEQWLVNIDKEVVKAFGELGVM